MVCLKKLLYFLQVAVPAAVCVLGSTAVIMAGMLIVSGILQAEISEDVLYGMSGTFGVGAAGVLIWAFIYKKKKWQSVREREPFQIGRAFGYALLAVCICKVVYWNVSAWILSLCLPFAESETAGAQEPLLLQICMGVILAPLTEELLFRKDLYALFIRRYSRTAALFLTTAAFAAVHGYGIRGFFSCVLAGFLFTYFYDRTGCLWYSIVAHMLCNLESLVYDLLSRKQAVLFGRQIVCEIGGYSAYNLGIFVMAGILSALLVWKFRKKTVSKREAPGRKMQPRSLRMDFSSQQGR